MFSTAFATIKFLSLTRPWMGFSSFLGTGCLGAWPRSYLPISVFSTRMGLPVVFLVKVAASGLAVPLTPPKVAEGAYLECEPPSRLNLPERLEHTGFEVVLRPKVDAVGSKSAGY